MFRLPFTESNVIHQYICDVPQIMHLSSSDVQFSESVAFAIANVLEVLITYNCGNYLMEIEKTPEDSPEPEAHVVGDCSQTPGEQSAASEYFSSASSPGKLRAADEDGKGLRAEEQRLKPL
ncbi:Olfactory Receptor 14C36 [Manis pentadactyla]|nr:Olfactory Receptor 14C36 [Manis pentadactyla]